MVDRCCLCVFPFLGVLVCHGCSSAACICVFLSQCLCVWGFSCLLVMVESGYLQVISHRVASKTQARHKALTLFTKHTSIIDEACPVLLQNLAILIVCVCVCVCLCLWKGELCRKKREGNILEMQQTLVALTACTKRTHTCTNAGWLDGNKNCWSTVNCWFKSLCCFSHLKWNLLQYTTNIALILSWALKWPQGLKVNVEKISPCWPSWHSLVLQELSSGPAWHKHYTHSSLCTVCLC